MGLSNLAALESRVAKLFHCSRHLSAQPCSSIDSDRVKALNDMASHTARDAMLRIVAEACRQAVRHSDTVAVWEERRRSPFDRQYWLGERLSIVRQREQMATGCGRRVLQRKATRTGPGAGITEIPTMWYLPSRPVIDGLLRVCRRSRFTALRCSLCWTTNLNFSSHMSPTRTTASNHCRPARLVDAVVASRSSLPGQARFQKR